MRLSRARSRLFPAGEEVFGGQTSDLANDQSHLTGTRISAGKLVVPGEVVEGKYYTEVGPADFRGVELIDTNFAGLVSSKGGTVTAPAGVQAGDLLLMFAAQREQTVNSLTPQDGWTLVLNGHSDMKHDHNLTVWTRRVTNDEPSEYAFYTEQSGGTSMVAVMAFRNAELYGDELTWTHQQNAATVSHPIPARTDVMRGSMSVAAIGWWDAAAGALVSFPAPYTEVVDEDDTNGVEFIGLGLAWAARDAEAGIAAGTITSSQSVDSDTAHLIIKPLQQSIRVWTGESGSETFVLNETGQVHVKEIIGDVNVRGFLRANRGMGIIPKGSAQGLSAGTDTQITFAIPALDTASLWDNATDSLVFYDPKDRGVWEITFFAKWEGNSDGTRRKIWIASNNTGTEELAMSNVRAPALGNCTQEVSLFYIYDGTKSFDLFFHANSEVAVDVEGTELQASSHVRYKYLGDVE